MSTTAGLLPGPLPAIMVPGVSGQEACCLSSMHSRLLRAMWSPCWTKMTLSHLVEWPLRAPPAVYVPRLQLLQRVLPKGQWTEKNRAGGSNTDTEGEAIWGRSAGWGCPRYTESQFWEAGSDLKSSQFRMLKEARSLPTDSLSIASLPCCSVTLAALPQCPMIQIPPLTS